MIIYKLIFCHKNNKTFYVNNFGDHKRDFTHIDDVLKIMNKLLNINLKINMIYLIFVLQNQFH